MKKLIAAILMLFLFTPAIYAGETKSIVVTSGTQMQPGGGVSICVIEPVKDYDLSNWGFSFQLGKTDTGPLGSTAVNGGVTPVFYCSNILYASTDQASWRSCGTGYMVSGSSKAVTFNSGTSPMPEDFSSSVTPVAYIAFGYQIPSTPTGGATPYGVVHMR